MGQCELCCWWTRGLLELQGLLPEMSLLAMERHSLLQGRDSVGKTYFIKIPKPVPCSSLVGEELGSSPTA